MHRTRLVTAIATVALLAVPAAATAGAPVDRVTGGGQILAMDQTTGPGSTIAFTAQGDAVDAKGQIQFNDRTNGTGRNQVRAHYVVDCVDVEDDVARVSGVNRDDPDDGITMFIMDNGEGMMADMDIVVINPMGDGDEEDGACGVVDPSDEERMSGGLARGNVKTYDVDA